MLVALRAWAVRHLLRSKDEERYGDLIVFDDVLVYLPKEEQPEAPKPPPKRGGRGRRRRGGRKAA